MHQSIYTLKLLNGFIFSIHFSQSRYFQFSTILLGLAQWKCRPPYHSNLVYQQHSVICQVLQKLSCIGYLMRILYRLTKVYHLYIIVGLPNSNTRPGQFCICLPWFIAEQRFVSEFLRPRGFIIELSSTHSSYSNFGYNLHNIICHLFEFWFVLDLVLTTKPFLRIFFLFLFFPTPSPLSWNRKVFNHFNI